MSKKAIQDVVAGLNELLDARPEELTAVLTGPPPQALEGSLSALEVVNTAVRAATGGREVALVYDATGDLNGFVEKRTRRVSSAAPEPDGDDSED